MTACLFSQPQPLLYGDDIGRRKSLRFLCVLLTKNDRAFYIYVFTKEISESKRIDRFPFAFLFFAFHGWPLSAILTYSIRGNAGEAPVPKLTLCGTSPQGCHNAACGS